MNDILIKGAIKMLKNFISPHQMKQIANSLLTYAINYKNTLQKAEGETQIAAMAWDHNGEVFTSVVFLDADDKIVRYDQVKRADELIETFINKL